MNPHMQVHHRVLRQRTLCHRPARLLLSASLAALTMLSAVSAQAQTPCPRDTSPQAQGLPSTQRIFSWVQGVTQFGPRRTGSVASEQTAAYVKCQLETLGVQDVHYEPALSWKWETTRHSLHVNGKPFDSYPVAFSFVTPDQPSVFTTGPNGLNAEVVDIGSGTLLDLGLVNVKGKVVVFDLKFQMPLVAFTPLLEFLWDPELTVLEASSFKGNPYQTNLSAVARKLMDAGAVGFVGILSDYFESNKYHNEYYRLTQFTLPGLWITKSQGTALRAAMKAQPGKSTARLVLDGSRTWAPARAVVGVLPGKTKDTILVTSHHDSVWNGAVEDASGVASVLAQAQIAASKPASERDKTLMFVTMDSHFSGYQVHQAFVKKYITDKATPYNIVASVTLEHIGKQAVIENGQLVMREQNDVFGILENLSFDLSQQLEAAIRRHDLRRTGMINISLPCSYGVIIPTDASQLCNAGIPIAALISGPVYLYDQADTIDKVDQTKLQPVAKVFADLLAAMDKAPADKMGR